MDSKELFTSQCATPFSLSTIESQIKRKPRFQRQKSGSKCECHSISKNRSECDSFSLSKLYVKKSFIQALTPQKKQTSDFSPDENIQLNKTTTQKSNLASTRIQSKNDGQILRECTVLHHDENQNLVKSFVINLESIDQNRKQVESLLKTMIFYKEKCEKYQRNVKSIRKEKNSLQSQAKNLFQQNQKLKNEIQRLTKIIDQCIGHQPDTTTPLKKGINKNLAKLKQQYQSFRQEEQSSKKSLQSKYIEAADHLEEIKHQNQKLRQDLVKHNQLYNIKLKMMQQKEEFLQKTLSYTKNALYQLQNDYEQKQREIQQSKRYCQLISEKNKQIQLLKSKYSNIVKMLNGQKTRSQSFKKSQKQLTQKQRAFVPVSIKTKSRHSLQVKDIISSHKQNDNIDLSYLIKTNFTSRQLQNGSVGSIRAKFQDKEITIRENKQISYTNKSRERQKSPRLHLLKQSTSDLTLFSSNSLEISPQKQT